MYQLRASELKKTFAGVELFSDVGFSIQGGERLGLVGVNGSGKTTLMRILCGQERADGGHIWLRSGVRLGHLAQHAGFDPKKTLYEETIRVFAGLMRLETELERTRRALDEREGDMEKLVRQQDELLEQYQRDGGLTYKARTRSALMGMGFAREELEQTMGSLSGGQQSKQRMCRLLLSRPDLLLLDEPTNHLDMRSVAWLEGYLADYPGSILVISHDRYFLDRVTTATLELENGALTRYDGGYSRYLQSKRLAREIEEKHFDTAQKEIHRLEHMIRRFRSWNRERSVRTAEHKQHQLDKLRAAAKKPGAAPRTLGFAFSSEQRGGQDVLMAEDIAKGFRVPLFQNVNLHLRRGERAFLIGPNGCGKTTLLRILSGACAPDTGRVHTGARVEVGYYAQHQDNLADSDTPLEAVCRAVPHMDQTQVRGALAAFLFTGDDVFKPLGVLSGGERARVALLILMLGRANLLMLDEPTNHLDAPSREALETALEHYEGTMLIVTHDRYLINRLATRVLALTPNGLEQSVGNYDDYLARLSDKAPAPQAPGQIKRAKDARSASAGDMRRLRARVRAMENDIARLEAQIKEQQALLDEPHIACDYAQTTRILKSMDNDRAALEQAMHRWEALSEQLEQT